MEILTFTRENSDMLLTQTFPVDLTDPSEMEWVADFSEKMIWHCQLVGAAGLASNQVGINKHMCVYKEHLTGKWGTLVNAVLSFPNENNVEAVGEGCFSLPGLYLNLKRPRSVRVNAFGTDGKEKTFLANGWTSRAIQHEVDHLNGILFIQRYLESESRFKALVDAKGLK